MCSLKNVLVRMFRLKSRKVVAIFGLHTKELHIVLLCISKCYQSKVICYTCHTLSLTAMSWFAQMADTSVDGRRVNKTFSRATQNKLVEFQVVTVFI